MSLRLGALLRCMTWLLAICLCAAPLASASQADAAGLGELKQSGKVGEQVDGFVGAVAATLDPEARALVERVNAERREAYTEIAAKAGATLEQVSAVAGSKLVEGTPSGLYVRDSTGNWKRK